MENTQTERIIPSLTFAGSEWTDVLVEEGEYGNGDLAVILYVDYDLLADASVNLAAYGLRPEAGAFFVPNSSESEGLAQALVDAGVIETTGRTVTFGPFNTTAIEARLK